MKYFVSCRNQSCYLLVFNLFFHSTAFLKLKAFQIFLQYSRKWWKNNHRQHDTQFEHIWHGYYEQAELGDQEIQSCLSKRLIVLKRISSWWLIHSHTHIHTYIQTYLTCCQTKWMRKSFKNFNKNNWILNAFELFSPKAFKCKLFYLL